MRILVIEDEERVVTPIKKGLEELGFSATIAPDGHTGLRLALGGTFDLVITDIVLPGINGIDICKSIRQELPDIPIIMLTQWELRTIKSKVLTPAQMIIW